MQEYLPPWVKVQITSDPSTFTYTVYMLDEALGKHVTAQVGAELLYALNIEVLAKELLGSMSKWYNKGPNSYNPKFQKDSEVVAALKDLH